MLSDLVENLLQYSDNPGGCANYITTRIRELIGVRIVALVEHVPGPAGVLPQLISICPARKEADWQQPGMQRFVHFACQCDTPRLLDPMTDHEALPPAPHDQGKTFIVPLLAGSQKLGMIVLLGLMDPTGATDILATLTRIAGVIALIMRNSLLYRDMEQLVETRTRELAEREKFFRAMFEQAGVGVAQLEAASGRFVRVNRKYAGILGYSLPELEQLTYQAITYPDDLPEDVKNMALLKSGLIKEITWEKRYYHKTGAVIWVNLTLSSLGEMGSPTNYYMAIAQDISKRKLAEKSLRESEEGLNRLNKELEQRVQQRTAELEENNAELERMNRLFVGRELRMIELKEKIKALEKKI